MNKMMMIISDNLVMCFIMKFGLYVYTQFQHMIAFASCHLNKWFLCLWVFTVIVFYRKTIFLSS